MSALKDEPVSAPADGGKQNAIMRVLLEMGGAPPHFTKAAAVKIGNNFRVNIFAKTPDDITARVVTSAWVTPTSVALNK